MNTYTNSTTSIAYSNKVDVLSKKDLTCLQLDHPRSSINIRDGDKFSSFNLNTVASLLLQGKPNPSTGQPFRKIDIERITMYIESCTIFPGYSLSSLDTRDLYNRWIQTFDKDLNLENPDVFESVKKTRLEARCFLQAEDLVEIFRAYCGKGSLDNRIKAQAELCDKPIGSWLIRNTSLKETKYDKPMVITIHIGGESQFMHKIIIHKIGQGFYLGTSNKSDGTKVCRGDSAKDIILDTVSAQPTIIDMIESIPEIVMNNVVKSSSSSESEDNLLSGGYWNEDKADHADSCDEDDCLLVMSEDELDVDELDVDDILEIVQEDADQGSGGSEENPNQFEKRVPELKLINYRLQL